VGSDDTVEAAQGVTDVVGTAVHGQLGRSPLVES
jgi:hypothetical protein